VITLDVAGGRVNARLERAGEPFERVRMSEHLPMLCIGTDVRAPELRRFLQATTLQVIEHINREGGEVVAPTIQGGLAQAFWLGFEFGRSEER
jgi:hypothetical protein